MGHARKQQHRKMHKETQMEVRTSINDNVFICKGCTAVKPVTVTPYIARGSEFYRVLDYTEML